MTVSPIVKLNIGLRVLGRREDGFHELETVFYPFDGFHDTLEIVRSDKFEVQIDGPCYTGWDPDRDLTAKAWNLLHDAYGIGPVRIRLEKTSPVGAGLGGGSADGAQALRMLSELFSLGLSDGKLAEFAASLGSDCPFFIYSRPMLAKGRGEILSDFPLDLGAYEIRVELPSGVAVSTREAYAGIDSRPLPPAPLPSQAALLPVEEWKDALVNDFETSVFPLHPQIAALKEKFYRQGALYASMSGSGSAVFGIFTK